MVLGAIGVGISLEDQSFGAPHVARQEFGGTDLGSKGIENFMAYHRCGRFCNPNWKMPIAGELQWSTKTSTFLSELLLSLRLTLSMDFH